MKLGEETIQETKDMFVVSFLFIIILQYLGHFFFVQKLEGKISLSLEKWTSSNYYAFLAIVAHYVTNDGYYGKNKSMCCGLCWLQKKSW